MVKVGVHVSIAGGLDKAVDRAVEKGYDDFQIFSRNPRGWSSRDLSPEEVKRFSDKLTASGIFPAVDHMPYLPNLASPKEDVYFKSVEVLSSELIRCGGLGIPYLVTHLGSHTGVGFEDGLSRITGAVKEGLFKSKNEVMLLLENTAGSKNSMGGSFQDIAAILDVVESKRVGICLDTCHLFAAGYDIRTKEALEKTLQEFDDLIGMDRLRLIHLNDSKGALGSNLDRHEHIGLGKIGEVGFATILAHGTLRNLPMVLETPVDARRDDVGNILAVREMASRLER
jgi:deoxyribonuclease-4